MYFSFQIEKIFVIFIISPYIIYNGIINNDNVLTYCGILLILFNILKKNL